MKTYESARLAKLPVTFYSMVREGKTALVAGNERKYWVQSNL
jgi:hypothetical protein